MRVGDEDERINGHDLSAGGQQTFAMLSQANGSGDVVSQVGGPSGRVQLATERDVDQLGIDHRPLAARAIAGDVSDVRSEAKRVITLEVLGTPAPKGSNRAMLVGGRARFVPGGSPQNKAALMTWDQNVRHSASQACSGASGPVFVQRAVAVVVEFRLQRPAGHYRKDGTLKPSAPAYPSVKPDVDKLVRSTLDVLTGIVFDDDARIARLTAYKDYASQPGLEGATITVRAIE